MSHTVCTADDTQSVFENSIGRRIIPLELLSYQTIPISPAGVYTWLAMFLYIISNLLAYYCPSWTYVNEDISWPGGGDQCLWHPRVDTTDPQNLGCLPHQHLS
jgi:hypothetical protein